VDFRAMLRAGASDEEMLGLLVGVWSARTDNYSEIRTADTAKQRKVEMSYIGG
jgi:GTP 3',8-cyclase